MMMINEQNAFAALCFAAAESGQDLAGFTAEDMRGALLFAANMRATDSVAAARERLVDALFPGMDRIVRKPTKRTPDPKPESYQRVKVSKGEIRIAGCYQGRLVYDRTFKVGDTVEVHSYNLAYHGTILSVGKTVKTQDEHGTRTRMLSLYEFSWRNHDLDLERNAERNQEAMRSI